MRFQATFSRVFPTSRPQPVTQRGVHAALRQTHQASAPPPMNRTTLAASAVAVLLVPVSLGALLWRGALRAHDVAFAVDPFEIDLQLNSRNDDE